MSRRLHGFTIAEMLIALLIISLVLSAAIPTLTKKNAASDAIWQWSLSKTSAYFGEAASQTAIIGDTYLTAMSPALLNAYMANIPDLTDIATNNYSNHITNSGDKLALIKQASRLSDGTYSDLVNSHISFYTTNNSLSSSDSNIMYTGRLVLEKHNIGLGLGTLSNMVATTNTYQGKNTAIGHYAMMKNVQGSFNTALGEMALAKNMFGSNNTVVGFNAGLNLDRDSDQIYPDESITTSSTGAPLKNANGNTVIGSSALKYSLTGRYNTALGYNALGEKNIDGDGNTAVGSNACASSAGNYNVCIGLNSGNDIFSKNAALSDIISDYKILSETDGHLLFIGASPHGSSDIAPLIMGRMQSYLDSTNTVIPKRLSINAREFDVNTFNGDTNIFKVFAYSGSGSVDTTTNDRRGATYLTTLKNATKTTSLQTVGGGFDEVRLNVVKAEKSGSSATIKEGELWVNDGALKINAMTKNAAGAASGGSVLITSNEFTDGTKKKFTDFRINNGQIALFPGGDTRISNLNDSLSPSGAYIHIYNQDNKLDIHSATMDINGEKRAFIFGGARGSDDGSIFRVGTSSNLLNSQFYGGVMIKGLETVGTFNQNDVVLVLKSIYSEVFSISSDERLKNIQGDSKAGLKEINALEVKNFTYKADEKKTPHVGVIAQQVKKIFPNSVIKDDNGYYRVKREEIFYAVVNSIKELFAMIQDLTAKVTGLDERLKKLEQENTELKKQNEMFEKRLSQLEAKI